MGEAGRQRIRDHFPLTTMGAKMDDLLEQARRLAQTSPRPVPTSDQAQQAALEAIREVEWSLPRTSVVAVEPLSTRLRWWLFKLATTVGMPIQRLAIRLGLHWVDGLRQRVANLLQPKAP
jgi:hypothetical protein